MPQFTSKAARIPQQKRSREKVEAILRAAIQVLSEEGYSKTSTIKIANVAGVSVGTVYAYFPDKDAIFSAYVNQQVGEIFTSISSSLVQERPQSLEETVRAVITASVTFTANNRTSLAAMVGKIPGVYDGTMMQDVMERLYVVAESYYQSTGLVADSQQARKITYTLSNAVIGFFSRLVTDPGMPLDKQELIEELVSLILGYFERLKIS